jgi:hypothetical protein
MTQTHGGAGVYHVGVPIVTGACEGNGEHYTEADGNSGNQSAALPPPKVAPCHTAEFHFIFLFSLILIDRKQNGRIILYV